MHEMMKRKHEALLSLMIPNHGPLHLPNYSYLIMNTDLNIQYFFFHY